MQNFAIGEKEEAKLVRTKCKINNLKRFKTFKDIFEEIQRGVLKKSSSALDYPKTFKSLLLVENIKINVFSKLLKNKIHQK